MANFEEAYKKTSVFEGGYTNDEDDAGGETYRGVARNFWPKWSGWLIVDLYKNTADFQKGDIHSPKTWRQITAILQTNERLNILAKQFYQKNFWDTICGDLIVDQRVANNIYDWEVNSGEGYPAKASQRIVGATVDGDIGPKTVSAINTYDPDEFIKKFKDAREAFCRRIVANDPSQEKFLDGWIKRTKEA